MDVLDGYECSWCRDGKKGNSYRRATVNNTEVAIDIGERFGAMNYVATIARSLNKKIERRRVKQKKNIEPAQKVKLSGQHKRGAMVERIAEDIRRRHPLMTDINLAECVAQKLPPNEEGKKRSGRGVLRFLQPSRRDLLQKK